jgi:iron complex transport system substrate-binding protein
MKRLFGLMTMFVLVVSMLAGCTGAAGENLEVGDKSGETGTWPRTIVDAAGNEVVLEKKPERIAILHALYLEYFFALDNPPIASAGASIGDAMKALEEYETLKPYYGTAEIVDLGSAKELNLEAILAADPDVIVTFAGHVDATYDQLVQIAPVVQVDFNGTWQEQTLACAEIVGEEALAQNLIEEIETKIDQAKNTINQNSNQTVGLFRTDGKSFVTRGNKSYYETFGISKPSGYPDEYETLALEAVAEMNPDYVIFQDFKDKADTFVKAMDTSSVWQSMEAVKNGKVVYFDDSLNTFGPLAMELTAKKLVQLFEK